MHNFKNEHAHFMTVGLVAHEWEGDAKVMEPDEIIKWEWFDLKDLPHPRYFPSFGVIDNYLAKKFYIKDLYKIKLYAYTYYNSKRRRVAL